ncbi:D-alanyl-D-alanine dipeptidase [Lacrimispora xylanisolvens]|uniref:D-alanyl-D-alanine dipeptidase n=1 Tax=Lacrimispora xylanisolvens TaxID=384636 RepID=A0A2S6HQ92_9FIRM|nr:M15 family metallopeptidase [Hungatella xylanolytica]PPK79656.1 D-alanyl-D-alanine dipeptidase [Hungatella xylanolytica]
MNEIMEMNEDVNIEKRGVRTETMILLNDERVMNVTCVDNKEEMVTLRNIHKDIFIDESRSQISSKSDLFCYAREEVINRLKMAADSLPVGYQFLVKEAYRPLSRQKKSFEEAFESYKSEYPLKSQDEIYGLTCQYVAPIEVAGHPTGGAIDITLLKNGIEVDMGTEFNDIPYEPENLTYLYSQFISEDAKANRNILIECMEKAGFINYPTEWWHWSYGDCYWACLNHCDAKYSGVREEDIVMSGELI